MQMQMEKTMNGLDMEQLHGTIDAIKGDPEIAEFRFRSRNQWISGGENRSTIQGFYGAKQEDESRTEPFVYTNGEPPVLLGKNEGANPVEFLLHGLAGCITTTFVLHAAARGITIEELSTELEGDINLHGLLDMGDNMFPGYDSIRVKMHVKADCSDEELDDLMGFAHAHSPVCSTVCKPVPVILERAYA